MRMKISIEENVRGKKAKRIIWVEEKIFVYDEEEI